MVSSNLGRKPHDPDYGVGEYTLDTDQIGLLSETELTERLVQTFTQPGYQPPRLPAVAMELVSISQRPDTDFRDIESLLERDAMLTGEVLSVARSAFYSGRTPVKTLRAALVRVGVRKLRDIVMLAAVNLRVFRSATYGGCMERLRDHCQYTAHLCRLVSRYTPVDEDQAFLCGLLHDVGFAGILLALGDAGRNKEAPDLALLWSAIDGAHARAGARMVELWGLPAEIGMVVGAHHQVSIDGYPHPVAAIVCLAEALATELDVGLVPTGEQPAGKQDLEASGLLAHGQVDRSTVAIMEQARETLHISDSQIDLIREDAREWMAKLQ